jgi:hypothetical protein
MRKLSPRSLRPEISPDASAIHRITDLEQLTKEFLLQWRRSEQIYFEENTMDKSMGQE